MRLVLIRHGETRWNETHKFQGVSDIELSPKGKSQAQSLAESLKGETLVAIYTSPLIRARQTAEQIARYHACPVIIDEGLKELNQGQLEGLTGEDLRRGYPGFLKKWLQDPERTSLPQGESLGDLQRRAWASIERIMGEYPEGTVVVVAHSFVNLTILCRVLEIPLRHFRHFRQDATGKNIIEFSERGAVLHCLNDTCHLVETPKRRRKKGKTERYGRRETGKEKKRGNS
jgi:broad specificity phosphatase PhoE